MIFHLLRMGQRRLFLLALLLLLIIGTVNGTDHAQAAAMTTQDQEQDGVGIGSMMRVMVGSRPPSCAGRCWWCGGRRCIAVQVPITPQQDSKNSHGHGRPRRQGGAAASSSWSSPARQQQQQVSSYDDHSNYKPLSWRCKCGGAAAGGLKP